jgi:hypothetical protein
MTTKYFCGFTMVRSLTFDDAGAPGHDEHGQLAVVCPENLFDTYDEAWAQLVENAKREEAGGKWPIPLRHNPALAAKEE